MGVDTKAILISNPNVAQIAQAITDAYGVEPEIRTGWSDEPNPTHFILSFPDTQKPTDPRQLHVFTESSDYKEIFEGPSTQMILGAWGGSVEIMEMFARRFGGYVCDSDAVGDWRVVEIEQRPDIELPKLTPEAELNLDLARIIDAKAALEIRKITKDPEQFAKLIDALLAYRAKLADAA